MEMKKRNTNSLNETLKKREAAERERLMNEVQDGEEKVMALDDTQRIKVLSPGRLVMKRFFRNKLAIIGLAVLIFMFVFAFICPLFYPYSQTQIFYKYGKLVVDYASATERKESTVYDPNTGIDVHYSVLNRMDSYISEMEGKGETEMSVTDTDGAEYVVNKLGDRVYSLSASETRPVANYFEKATVASYNKLGNSFTWNNGALSEEFQAAASKAVQDGKESFRCEGEQYTITMQKKNRYSITRSNSGVEFVGRRLGDGFKAEADAAIAAGQKSFEFDGTTYRLRAQAGGYLIYTEGARNIARIASTFVFNNYDNTVQISDDVKAQALLALYGDGRFSVDGTNYSIAKKNGKIILSGANGEIAELSNYSVRRYSGQDTLDLAFKEKVAEVIDEMVANGQTKTSFVFSLPAMDAEANYIYDENGKLTYEDTNLTVTRTTTQYVINCEQTTYLIDIHARPSKEHWLGTDGDGMDLLARAMYGGRISLMVGFVVVLLETFLGIILGGLAGFFGGWVDTLIMRLVDVFYCIPSMPILIIMGAFFDALKMNAYVRLIWLMAILGILGWAGVARLVRGQILSLREQEFMVAEEATGMRAGKRIFRHLVPNVMPQLIVSATMGLGSVIITESTLSFLGLGVKHPLATWGNMINSVTGSSEDMIRYAYIWVPIGLLICLTVIAFNFVGDGLRDAFDPKMKQ
mgnify:FL=1